MNHPKPRLIHPLPDPLGLYIRPGYVDHRALLALLAEGQSAFTGIVFEPSWGKRQEELRTEIRRRDLDCVLDTRVMELATEGVSTHHGPNCLGRDTSHTGSQISPVRAGTGWPIG